MYRIPEENMKKLRSQIEALARKAEQFGAPPIYLKIHGTEDHEDKEGRITRYWLTTVEGEVPRLKGWRFVGKIIFFEEGNVLQLVREQEKYGDVPEKFRTCEPWCDWCKLSRNRIKTYIVANQNEEYMQVGSNCLIDFTGHEDPVSVLASAEFIWEAEAACQEARELDEDWVTAFPRYLNLETYLTFVAACVRQLGWTPRSQKDYAYPSADAAYDAMISHKHETRGQEIQISPSDSALVGEAIQWIRDKLPQRGNLSDYEWNLVVALSDSAIPDLLTGIAASAIPYYQREKERLAIFGGSEYQGEIGERKTFADLKLIRIFTFDGRFGTTNLMKFQDPKGNILIWYSSKRLEEDRTYFGSATVKGHEEYKGIKQTLITRCKFQEGECQQAKLL